MKPSSPPSHACQLMLPGIGEAQSPVSPALKPEQTQRTSCEALVVDKNCILMGKKTPPQNGQRRTGTRKGSLQPKKPPPEEGVWLFLLWKNMRKRLLQQKTANRLTDGLISKTPVVVGAILGSTVQFLYWWLKQ